MPRSSRAEAVRRWFAAFAATWLVTLCADERTRDGVLGDLQEEFTTITHAHGPAKARRWYFRQAVLSSARFAIEPLVRRPSLMVLVGVAAVFLRVAVQIGMLLAARLAPEAAIQYLFEVFQRDTWLWGMQRADVLTMPIAGWLLARYSRMRPMSVPLVMAIGQFAFSTVTALILVAFRLLPPDVTVGTGSMLFGLRYTLVVLMVTTLGAVLAAATPRLVPVGYTSRRAMTLVGEMRHAGTWLYRHRDYAGQSIEPREPREPNLPREPSKPVDPF